MITTKTLKTGKLYIKFINHKLTFKVIPYNRSKSYNNNLLHNSKLGYRQTPITDIRLIDIIKFILKDGFKVSHVQGINASLVFEIIIKNPDLEDLVENLEVANLRNQIEIHKISFVKDNSKIIINNNGMISATKNIYLKSTKQITKFLVKTEA